VTELSRPLSCQRGRGWWGKNTKFIQKPSKDETTRKIHAHIGYAFANKMDLKETRQVEVWIPVDEDRAQWGSLKTR